MYLDELVTPGNIDEVKDNLGDFDYVDEIEVGDVSYRLWNAGMDSR